MSEKKDYENLLDEAEIMLGDAESLLDTAMVFLTVAVIAAIALLLILVCYL